MGEHSELIHVLTNKNIDMEFLLTSNDGRIVKAKSSLEALKSSGYDNIYWNGNKPYSYTSIYSNEKVFAIRKPKNAVWK